MGDLYNTRYDLAIRAVLCGTSTGNPLTRLAVERLVGDNDLSGFFAYAESSTIGRWFRILTDGRFVTLGIASRALLARESPVSNAALAVFLFILKWHQDNSVPVPKTTIIEQFVSAERSAARTVTTALEELKRLFWIEESRPEGGASRYVPTRIGIQSLGSRFLQKVVAASQGREFRPSEVRAFFQVTGPDRRGSEPRDSVAPLTLFDYADADRKYERALRRIIVGTTTGRPPTTASVRKMLGEESLEGLYSYCAATGLDRFLSLAESGSGKHLVALVEASRVFQAGQAPLTANAVAVAVMIWYLEEKLKRSLARSDLLPVMAGRAKNPSMTLSRTLTMLEKKGWIRRSGESGRFRMTPAGRQCLALALTLRPGPGVEAILDEFVQSNLAEVAAAAVRGSVSAGAMNGEPEDAESAGDMEASSDDPD